MKGLLLLTASYMLRSRRHLVYASVGLVAGTATLLFFLGLSAGIRERVLNRLYPVNQIEFQTEKVRIFGLGIEVPSQLDEAALSVISARDDVRKVFPKQRSTFQARLWGGADIFGSPFRVEAFFDGIDPNLVFDELQASETSVLGVEIRDTECSNDRDCGPGAGCDARRCVRDTWWNRFVPTEMAVVCQDDHGCPPGKACVDSICMRPCESPETDCGPGMKCVDSACRKTCDGPEADCGAGRVCSREGVCTRLECVLSSASDQMADEISPAEGHVTGVHFGRPVDILPDTCPKGTYCATESLLTRNGFCERPIPVLLSPFLLDVYNDVAAGALGMRRLAGLEVVLGIPFTMMFGESYFARDEPSANRVVRRCFVTGFSSKAMDFGVTMPLGDAVAANAMLRGRENASVFSSVIIETNRNEDIPALVDDMKVLGLVLAPRSEAGRKAADVLAVLTMVFGGVSLIILLISAINISHTFLMLVSERRREIAVYRSVGATSAHIRLMVSGEALVLGISGGAAGDLVGWLFSRLANSLAAPMMHKIPGSPSDLFQFGPGIFAGCLACAVLFALAGAQVPSARAAATDPATVLSQE